jgi:branched-subunit amino acid aminotransferase/4-amino-4-deoxychorismate lyase
LARSAERFRLTGAPDLAEVREACVRLASENGIESGRLRITLAAGAGEGPGDALFMTLTPYRPPADETVARGWSCRRAPFHRDRRAPTTGHKCGNFLDAFLFRRTLGPDEEGLLLNEAGRLCEGCYTNLFVVSGGRAATPPLSEGPLPGVTRAALLETAAALSVSLDERSLTWEDLIGAEEAFLTNALMGVVPLTSAESHPVGTGVPGPVMGRLRAGYMELVHQERV